MKLFGVLSAGVCNILLLPLLYFLSPNIENFSFVENIPVTGYVFFVALCCWYVLTFRKVNIYVNHSLFLIFVTVCFFYLHSVLVLSIKIDDYESFSEWNAARGISGIFFIPFVFIISIIKGFGYDYLINKKHEDDKIPK